MHPTVDGVILPPVKRKGRRGRNMKLRLVLLLTLLAGTFVADAAGTKADVRKTIEHSMLVTGTIHIGTDGTVVAHHLDNAEKLPPPVRDLIAKALPIYRFEPIKIDGQVVKARAKLGVRVVAKQIEEGKYQLRIGGVSFGDEGGDERESVNPIKMTPPIYPPAAYVSGTRGTVYLLLKIGQDGKVQDLAAEQVNLKVLGNERKMEQARKVLADASVEAARKWTFNVPTRGPQVAEPFWSVRVPVDYMFHEDRQVGYGQWEAYVPGPRHTPVWAEDESLQSPDAMIAGMLYTSGAGPKLITPVPQG